MSDEIQQVLSQSNIEITFPQPGLQLIQSAQESYF